MAKEKYILIKEGDKNLFLVKVNADYKVKELYILGKDVFSGTVDDTCYSETLKEFLN